MARHGTKAELESLQAAAKYCADQGLPLAKHLNSLYGKLVGAKAKPASALTPISRIEAALVEAGRGKVLPLECAHQGTWISLQARFGAYKATEDEAAVVGTWMSQQGWLKGTMTIDQVLRQWPSWLTRARAETTQHVESANAWQRPDL